MKIWDVELSKILKNKKIMSYLIAKNAYIRNFDTKRYTKYYENYESDISKALQIKGKKSETVFILGSGGSIRDISKDEWEKIQQHDTLTFNWFAYQDFVEVDYYLIKDLYRSDKYRNIVMPKLNEFSRLIYSNIHLYKNCLFLLQDGLIASVSNNLLYNRLLPQESAITRYIFTRNTRQFSMKLPYLEVNVGTLETAINFAFLNHWKNIVLVGIDLYNRDYFWLNENEIRTEDLMRNAKKDEIHNTAKNGIINIIEENLPLLKEKGINLTVYNPKSLLNNIIPVFKWD